MELLKDTYKFGGITYLVYSNGDIYEPTGKKIKPRKPWNTIGNAVKGKTWSYIPL